MNDAKPKRKTKNQFKKGHKLSVGYGRPKLTEAERELSLKNRTEFKKILNKYMIQSVKQLRELYDRKDLPAIDGMLIKAIVRAFENGDQTQINWFIDHTMGKEKETTNINLNGSMENKNTIDLKSLSKEELLALKSIAEKNKK